MERVLQAQNDLAMSSGYSTRKRDNSARYVDLLPRKTQAEKAQAEIFVPSVYLMNSFN
jgi:hypothetical protein